MWLRAISAALALVVALLLSGRAYARYPARHDLDSLAFEHDAIVSATKIAERDIDGDTIATFRLTRVYVSRVGSDLEVGTTIERRLSRFAFGAPGAADPVDSAPEVEPEMVFFLTRTKQGERPEPGVEAGTFSIGSSEMRFFVDGRVHRFSSLVHIGGPAIEHAERPRASKMPFDRAGFDVELERSITRAKEAREQLARTPSAARTKRLLEVARDPRVREDGADTLGAAIIVALGKTRDVDAVLDAQAGAPRAGVGSDHGIAPQVLVDAAARATTVERRLAALELLRGMGFSLAEKDDVGPKLAKLIDDPERSIRLAVIDVWFTHFDARIALSDAILARFATETDPRVRISLYGRAHDHDRVAKLNMTGVELPLVAAAAHPDEGDDPALDIEWTDRELSAENVIVELRDGERLVHAEDLRRRAQWAPGGNHTSAYTVPLMFPAPVAEREYDVTLDLVLRRSDSAGKRSERVHRRISIGKAKVGRRETTGITRYPSLLEPPTGPEPMERRTIGLIVFVVVALVVGAMLVVGLRRPSED